MKFGKRGERDIKYCHLCVLPWRCTAEFSYKQTTLHYVYLTKNAFCVSLRSAFAELILVNRALLTYSSLLHCLHWQVAPLLCTSPPPTVDPHDNVKAAAGAVFILVCFSKHRNKMSTPKKCSVALQVFKKLHRVPLKVDRWRLQDWSQSELIRSQTIWRYVGLIMDCIFLVWVHAFSSCWSCTSANLYSNIG